MPKHKLDRDGHLIIEKPYAKTTVTPTDDTVGCLRIYRDSPESVLLQIRTVGHTGQYSKGVKRTAFSHCSLQADELDSVIAALQKLRAELRW